MKSTTLTRITATALFTAVAISAQTIAQREQEGKREHPTHYRVKDLGTLGGTFSYAAFITKKGLIAGRASPADGTWHAVLWPEGVTTPRDIATPGLGGQNSEAFGANERGQVAGYAETRTPDPNGEDFCGFKAQGLPTSGTTCLAFLWQHGVMTPLPTLGGPNGSAGQINDRGEIVGYAENTTVDPACPAPQVLESKPVVWENGNIHELSTFPGDPEGAAFGINDNGQVAGASGTCTTFSLTGQTYLASVHALLWEKPYGAATDLGNLGGKFGNGANAVNNRAQVVGSSDLPGDTIFHGFLWTKHRGMQDLRPLRGDVYSAALEINERGDIAVGISLDESFSKVSAVLWENGLSVPVNLNALVIDNDSGLDLQLAEGTNSRGEIVGFARTSSGDTHGFLAIPCHRHDDGRECCEDHDR